VPDVPKHIADTSPMATPADREDRPDRAERNPRAGPAVDAGATPGVAIGPPTARTVVIRPLLVAYYPVSGKTYVRP
jgi:hypothetical protein